MGMQVVIDPIGKGITQFLKPNRTFFVHRFGFFLTHKHLGSQIAVQSLFSFDLCQTAGGPDIIAFYPGKIIFALGIEQSKDGICITDAVDVRHPEFIANDFYAIGLFHPLVHLGLRGLVNTAN